jgi:hypothetical protein
VIGELEGQLGNQCFVIAATVSLALDHDATPIFPDLIGKRDYNIPLNHEKIFFRLHSRRSCPAQLIYREPHYHFAPIPYHPNMKIKGYFQSEKYFMHHKREILELFAPSPEIVRYLTDKYADLLAHPCTVAIHVRFYHEDPEQKCHLAPRREYVEKAMALFPEGALFVVFSNQIEKCKELLAGIDRPMRWIEGESHYHDFYLMSLCKHNIISNSSFSWWGAYLNTNPTKVVVAPRSWYNPAYGLDTRDLLPDSWIVID